MLMELLSKASTVAMLSFVVLGVTNTRTENLFCGGKLPSGQEGRLIDHWEDRTRDEVPSRIEVEGIDRLNIQDILCVVGVAYVKVRIVLEGHANQIGDGILCGVAQALSLLCVSRRSCSQDRGHRCNGSDETSIGMNHWSIPLAAATQRVRGCQ